MNVEVLAPDLVRVTDSEGNEMTIQAKPEGGLGLVSESTLSCRFHHIPRRKRRPMFSAAGRKFAQLRHRSRSESDLIH